MKYTTNLISKEKIAERTFAFHFELPQGFVFEAGQTIDLTLLDPHTTDKDGNTRAYTIASAPHEKDLMIATRIRESSFKKNLVEAALDFPVQIEGPFGSFTLHEKSSRPAVMLVGGIGSTPFRSIVADATEKKLPHKMYLFYSNRRPEDAPFFDEFKQFTNTNKNFIFIPTMTDNSIGLDWKGDRGYITKALIDTYVKDQNDAVYYLAGPQEMVKAMKKLLHDAGVSGDDMKMEEFSGY